MGVWSPLEPPIFPGPALVTLCGALSWGSPEGSMAKFGGGPEAGGTCEGLKIFLTSWLVGGTLGLKFIVKY